MAHGGVEYNSATADSPSFATIGRTFRIVTTDTVVLPCEVINPRGYLLAWKRGIAILTAGNIKVTPDERFRLVEGYNLEIRDVKTHDAGDYVCQIATLHPLEITHTLEILVPSRIHSVTSDGTVEVKKGSTVTLECRASGNPVPTISWTRKNNLLPSGEKSMEGFSITIVEATRHQAGIYLCSANNGVGDPATAQIALHVLYPPEIEVERSWVHSGEGYEAQLVCIVHAEPQAEVVWYRDTLRLDTTERRIMEVRGSRHTLIIRKVQASDFGNYSCVADNSMGKAREYLELSGKPNPAIFRSHHMGRFKDSYNLTWSVNSYTPIEEFKLYFRRLPPPPVPGQLTQPQYHHNKRPTRRENETWGGGGSGIRLLDEWNDVILPAAPSEQFTQQMSYMIRGLEPAFHYEARVQAKNRFGWNDISDTFHFTTRGSDPEMRDMGVTAQTNASTRVIIPVFLSVVQLALAVCWS
ncbi:limbic system-associated membrane protein-like [Lycorma delicatula]|uniref:limbic system-associated membrane protein-like n=1 Tax=Lycorma delicatula TaxID=130591 RepID=UPI003F512D8F